MHHEWPWDSARGNIARVRLVWLLLRTMLVIVCYIHYCPDDTTFSHHILFMRCQYIKKTPTPHFDTTFFSCGVNVKKTTTKNTDTTFWHYLLFVWCQCKKKHTDTTFWHHLLFVWCQCKKKNTDNTFWHHLLFMQCQCEKKTLTPHFDTTFFSCSFSVKKKKTLTPHFDTTFFSCGVSVENKKYLHYILTPPSFCVVSV